jgi:hypothetical protein
MNMHAENFPSRVRFAGSPAASFRNPAGVRRRPQLAVVAISETISALVFDEPLQPQNASRRRLTAVMDGNPPEPPYLATQLELSSGGLRHVFVLSGAAEALAVTRSVLYLQGVPSAGLDPEWLQSPLSDATALIGGLTDTARRKLIHLLMTTGASLFRLCTRSGSGSLLDQLLSLEDVRTLPLASACSVGTSARILSWRLPAAFRGEMPQSFVLEDSDRTRQFDGVQAHLEVTGAHSVLHLYCPTPPADDTRIVALAEPFLRLAGSSAELSLQPIGPWLERRDPSTVSWARDQLRHLGETDAMAASGLREMNTRPDDLPSLDIHHLSVTRSGLLYAFCLSDTHDLVSAIRLERDGEVRDIAVDGQPLVGYLPWAHPGSGSCRVRLVYGSGRLQSIQEGDLPQFEGDAPKALSLVDHDLATRVLASARSDGPLPFPRGGMDIEQIGPRPTGVRISLIAPTGPSVDILRARAAAIFSQAEAPEVELVTFMPEPQDRSAARLAHQIVSTTFDLPVRLLTLKGRWTAADALRAALSEAAGDIMLVLGAGVVPNGPAWCAHWISHISDEVQIVGGTLLDASDTVLDAGASLTNSAARVEWRLRGATLFDLPSTDALPTCAASCACVALGPDARDLFLSTPAAHPNPDVLLARAIRRLTEENRISLTSLRARCLQFSGSARQDRLLEAADRLALTAAIAGKLFEPAL